MECCIYIKQEINNLRQVIITQKNINNGYALKIYQHYSVMNNMYVANYVPVSAINLDNCHCYSEGIYGCLGLICIKGGNYINISLIIFIFNIYIMFLCCIMLYKYRNIDFFFCYIYLIFIILFKI